MMNSSKQSAYRLAPWRKQMQRILTILLLTFVAAAVTLIYLSISERMTDVNLRIQTLQNERSGFANSIADLTSEEGALTAYRKMQERAAAAGFTDINFYDDTQYAYVVIDGYTDTGVNTESQTREIPRSEYVSLVKPEYTESLQDWLYRRITTGIESYEITN